MLNKGIHYIFILYFQDRSIFSCILYKDGMKSKLSMILLGNIDFKPININIYA